MTDFFALLIPLLALSIPIVAIVAGYLTKKTANSPKHLQAVTEHSEKLEKRIVDLEGVVQLSLPMSIVSRRISDFYRAYSKTKPRISSASLAPNKMIWVPPSSFALPSRSEV